MRRATFAIATLSALLGTTPLWAQTAPPVQGLSRCVEADAALGVTLNSAVNTPGDAFSFTMLEPIPAAHSLPEIPLGTKGYGVVAYVQHAESNGRPGMLVLEPRFVRLANGTRVPVMADPGKPERVARGATRDAPGVLEMVPVVGLAFGGYNALHRGKEVVLPKGTRLRVVLGDELATSSCYVPAPENNAR